MKSLVLLAALLLVGCSVEVSHQTEDENHTEKSSTVERSRTTVGVGLLHDPTPRHEPEAPNEIQSPSIEGSKTVKVIVSKPSPKVVTPTPHVVRCPDQLIRVTGSGNTIIFGDVHLHRHDHMYQAPKPHPVRINVRVELGDRISERERRTRMVERRIAKFFPHYRD
jgi:hypothetical protein